MESWQLSSAFAVSALGTISLIFDWKVPCFKFSSGLLVLSRDGKRWIFLLFLPPSSFCLSEDYNHVSILSRLSITNALHPSLPAVSYRFPVTVVCLSWPVSNCSQHPKLDQCSSWVFTHEGGLDSFHMTSFLGSDDLFWGKQGEVLWLLSGPPVVVSLSPRMDTNKAICCRNLGCSGELMWKDKRCLLLEELELINPPADAPSCIFLHGTGLMSLLMVKLVGLCPLELSSPHRTVEEPWGKKQSPFLIPSSAFFVISPYNNQQTSCFF